MRSDYRRSQQVSAEEEDYEYREIRSAAGAIRECSYCRGRLQATFKFADELAVCRLVDRERCKDAMFTIYADDTLLVAKNFLDRKWSIRSAESKYSDVLRDARKAGER